MSPLKTLIPWRVLFATVGRLPGPPVLFFFFFTNSASLEWIQSSCLKDSQYLVSSTPFLCSPHGAALPFRDLGRSPVAGLGVSSRWLLHHKEPSHRTRVQRHLQLSRCLPQHVVPSEAAFEWWIPAKPGGGAAPGTQSSLALHWRPSPGPLQDGEESQLRRWLFSWNIATGRCSMPSINFLSQLLTYEKQLFGSRLTSLDDIRRGHESCCCLRSRWD